MAIHSSILAWKISWTEEPGGLFMVHGVTQSQTFQISKQKSFKLNLQSSNVKIKVPNSFQTQFKRKTTVASVHVSLSLWFLAQYSEKAMAPHSSTLAWKIPWTEAPGRLQSTGSRRVGHDWATSLSLFTFMHWRRKWQSTPVFLPGESRGRGSLEGCNLWGHTESDTTEVT